MLAICNICGGDTFSEGPAGRLSVTQQLPHCTTCGSLERHRINRALFEQLPIRMLSWRKALQFSPDLSLNPNWFRSFEISVYGGANSLDMQEIRRPDAAYDFISLSHVLEFIPNDLQAMRELNRILSPHGIIHMVLSQPLTRQISLDFSEPQGVHQYFHLYGLDFDDRFDLKGLGLFCAVLTGADPVTGAQETAHILGRSERFLSDFHELIQKSFENAHR